MSTITTKSHRGLIDLIESDATQIAGLIDHTLLRPDAVEKDIERLCDEAKQYQFASVCINPTHVRFAVSQLLDSDVKVCTVVGFPLGATTTDEKVHESRQAIEHGAKEIDMVINIGAAKAGEFDFVRDQIAAVVQATHAGHAICKVIIETSFLNDEEIMRVCQFAKGADADFVKTSTGFSSGGATLGDVALMRQTVGQEVGVKASGGIRDLHTSRLMILAGANRLGLSKGVEIMQEVLIAT